MNIFFSILSILYIAAIFLLGESPVVSDIRSFNPYSLLHVPLYGFLTLFLVLSFPQKREGGVGAFRPDGLTLLIAGSIALLVAVADEIHQAFLPSRNASAIDVVLDIVGIILCMALLHKAAFRVGRINVRVFPCGRARNKIEN